MGFAKKGVYQSELVAATANGPLQIILTDHPKPSKFAGKPQWLPFKVAGEESEHQLHCENDAIVAMLAAQPLNAVLSIRAFGSRDDARVEIGGGTVTAASRTQQPSNAAPNGNGNSTQHHDERPHAILAQYSDCFLAALEIVRRGTEKVPELKGATPDAMLAATKEISATLFIEQNRAAGTRPLRSHAAAEG